MEALSYCQLMERCLAAEARVVELESRTVTVKIPYLPDNCDRTEAHFKYQAALTAAGIKWEVE